MAEGWQDGPDGCHKALLPWQLLLVLTTCPGTVHLQEGLRPGHRRTWPWALAMGEMTVWYQYLDRNGQRVILWLGQRCVLPPSPSLELTALWGSGGTVRVEGDSRVPHLWPVLADRQGPWMSVLWL